MPDEVNLVINPDGSIDTIYSDKIKTLLESAGGEVTQVCRASNVEWESSVVDGVEVESGWTVRSAANKEVALRISASGEAKPDTVGPLVFFKTREAALAEEIAHFWRLLKP